MEMTVVGGGLSGLVSSIALAERGHPVRLFEAQRRLGGRGRSSTKDFRANFGPHVLYARRPFWAWLEERDLVSQSSGVPVTARLLFRTEGKVSRVPPVRTMRHLATIRHAPADKSLREWLAEMVSPRSVEPLCMAAGVFTFDADPGRLSAAFVWERLRFVALQGAQKARYITGGWTTLIESLAAHARGLGVTIEIGTPVDVLPAPPVIVATHLQHASELLGRELSWPSGRSALLDLGLRAHRKDPFAVWDMDEAGWIETFSQPDPSLAPKNHSLVQAQIGIRPGETLDDAIVRLEGLLDASFDGWRDRVAYRRVRINAGESGALDLPGATWRDRPAIEQGQGVFIAGDMVAADGVLSEVSWASALEAARKAEEFVRTRSRAART